MKGYALILAGRCEVRHLKCASPGGPHRQRCAEMIGPGDSFGFWGGSEGPEMYPRIKAMEDVLLLRLDPAEVHRLIEERPELTSQWLTGIRRRDGGRPSGSRWAGGGVTAVLALSAKFPRRSLAAGLVKELDKGRPGSVAYLRVIEHPAEPALPHLVDREVECAGRDAVAALSGITEKFRQVIVEITCEVAPADTLAILGECDAALVAVGPEPECLYEFELLAGQFTGATGRTREVLRPVFWLPRPVAPVAPAALTLRHWPCEPPEVLRGEDEEGRAWHEPLRRMGRELAGARLGLALSSGGAKGLAHIGVLQVLEEHGIDIDVVAGASMGAYIGAAWALGLSGRQMELMARELESRWGLWQLLDPCFPPRLGFVGGKKIRARLDRLLAGRHFCDLPRPLRIVATRLDTYERVVLSRGEVAAAVQASLAVPGVCVPVNLEGKPHVDGGIIDPVPVDVLREMGIEKVIAINTLPTASMVRE